MTGPLNDSTDAALKLALSQLGRSLARVTPSWLLSRSLALGHVQTWILLRGVLLLGILSPLGTRTESQ